MHDVDDGNGGFVVSVEGCAVDDAGIVYVTGCGDNLIKAKGA